MDARTTLRAMNARLDAALRRAVCGLDDEQIRVETRHMDQRSFAEAALHSYAVLEGFALVAAGQDWPEEELPVPTTAAELAALLGEKQACVDSLIASLTDEALERVVTLPWGQTQLAADALADGLADGFIHAGAIQALRAIAGYPSTSEEY